MEKYPNETWNGLIIANDITLIPYKKIMSAILLHKDGKKFVSVGMLLQEEPHEVENWLIIEIKLKILLLHYH